MKLYIAVLDSVPDYIIPTLVAHAVLRGHINFAGHQDYEYWLNVSFRKVVVKVNYKEFLKIQDKCVYVPTSESSVNNGETSCVVVRPSTEIPNVLKFAKLWKPEYKDANNQ